MGKFTGKGRPILLAVACILFLFFTNDFGGVSLENTAIIVACGVDYDGSSYTVSCQLADSDTSQGNTPSQQQVVICGQGSTPATALSDLIQQTGWYPNLNFCYAILLGEETLQYDLMEVLDFFLRSEDLNDAALVCACEGKAEELLKAKTPLDSVSAFTVLKVIYQSGNASDAIMGLNLKFLVNRFYGKSNGLYMTYLTYREADTGASDPQDGKNVFETNRAVVFRKEFFSHFLERAQIRAFNHLTQAVRIGSFELSDLEADGQKIRRVEFQTSSPKAEASYLYENGLPKIRYKLDLSLVIRHLESDDDSIENISSSYQVDEGLCRAVEEAFGREVRAFLDDLSAYGTDVLSAQENFFKFNPEGYRLYTKSHPEEDFFRDLTFEFEISAHPKK